MCLQQSDFKASWYLSTLYWTYFVLLPPYSKHTYSILPRSCSILLQWTSFARLLRCMSCTGCKFFPPCACCAVAYWFRLHYDRHIKWLRQFGGFSGFCKSRDNKQTKILWFHWLTDNRKVLLESLRGKHVQSVNGYKKQNVTYVCVKMFAFVFMHWCDNIWVVMWTAPTSGFSKAAVILSHSCLI